jgi:hypothetical protein
LSMWRNMRKKQLIERKHERKRLFRRRRRKWKDNIEMYLRELRLNAVYWSDLAYDGYQRRAFVYTVMGLLLQ